MGIGAIFRRLAGNKFLEYGFSYEVIGPGFEGWMSRDGVTDDFILWSKATQQMYRSKGGKTPWFPSPEVKSECLRLGKVYAERMGWLRR